MNKTQIKENSEDKTEAIKRANEYIKYALLDSNRRLGNLLFSDALFGLYDDGFQDGIKQYDKWMQENKECQEE